MNTDRPESLSSDDVRPANDRRRRAVQLATTALVNTALATTALLGALEGKLPRAQGD